jgi:hypothetical protein
MGPVLTKAAVALGLDAVMRWLMSLVAGLVVICLTVVLIVGGTFAAILGGTQAGSAPPAERPQTSGQWSQAHRDPGADDRLIARLGTASSSSLEPGWGVPYVFGGCSVTGVDCSCLVQKVYAAIGIHVPRVAVNQFNGTIPVSDPQPRRSPATWCSLQHL